MAALKNIMTIALPAEPTKWPPIVKETDGAMARAVASVERGLRSVERNFIAPIRAVVGRITGGVSLALGGPAVAGLEAASAVFARFHESAKRQSEPWARVTAAFANLLDRFTEGVLKSAVVQKILGIFAEALEGTADQLVKIGGTIDALWLDAKPRVEHIAARVGVVVTAFEAAKIGALTIVYRAAEIGLSVLEGVRGAARGAATLARAWLGKHPAARGALMIANTQAAGVLAGAREWIAAERAGAEKALRAAVVELADRRTLEQRSAAALREHLARGGASGRVPDEQDVRTWWERVQERIENWAGSPAAHGVASQMRASLALGTESLARQLEGVRATIAAFRQRFRPALAEATKTMLGAVEGMAGAHAVLAGQLEAVARSGSAMIAAAHAVKMHFLALTTALLAAQQIALGIAAFPNIPLMVIRFAAAAAYTLASGLALGGAFRTPSAPRGRAPARNRLAASRSPIGRLVVEVEGSILASEAGRRWLEENVLEPLRMASPKSAGAPRRLRAPAVSRGAVALTVAEFVSKELGKRAAEKFAGEFFAEMQGVEGQSLARSVRQEIGQIPAPIREAIRGVLTSIGGPFGFILGGVLSDFFGEAASFFEDIF